MEMAKIAREIGSAVKKAARNPNQRWYNPHMIAASRAIAERMPLVDILLEIRDAQSRIILVGVIILAGGAAVLCLSEHDKWNRYDEAWRLVTASNGNTTEA